MTAHLPCLMRVGDVLTNGKRTIRVATVDPHGLRAKRPNDEPCYRIESRLDGILVTPPTWWTSDEIEAEGYRMKEGAVK